MVNKLINWDRSSIFKRRIRHIVYPRFRAMCGKEIIKASQAMLAMVSSGLVFQCAPV